ncbi:hypothetical protein PTKIN_Ptkin03bG0072200 [Pterospermum kingtungense]
MASHSKIRSHSFPRSVRENSHQQCIDLPSLLDSRSPLFTSYTSLKDLIPSRKGSNNNPYSKGLTRESVNGIPITNLPVKEGSWADLPPMPEVLPSESSCASFSEHFFSFVSDNLMSSFTASFRFIASAFDKFLRWWKL